jgi:secreted PhoX family phosphatase
MGLIRFYGRIYYHLESIMRVKPLNYLMLGILAASTGLVQAKTFSAKSSVNGTAVQAEMDVENSDDGVAGKMFLAVELNGHLQFYDGQKWLPFISSQVPPAYYTGALAKRALTVADLNSSLFAGANVYIGYGRDFDDMLKRLNYGLVFVVPKQPVSNPLGIAAVDFSPTPAPVTPQERAGVFTRSSIAVKYNDGTVSMSRLNYHTLYHNTDLFNGVAAGASYNSKGELLKAANGSPLIAETPDGQSLMQIAGAKASVKGGNSLFLVTHFEYQWKNPGAETGLYGEIPNTMKLSTIDQNKSNGQLSVVDLKNVDMSAVNGLWIPCAGSLSPWNTHLGSEEYEPDARAFEEKPLAPFWTENKTDSPWLQAMSIWFAGDNSKIKPYNYGTTPEVAVKADGTTNVVKHQALGRISRELAQVMPDQRTVYQGDDGTYNVLTLFIADKPADLSAGTLYAAKWNQTSSDKGGAATLTWYKLGQANDAELATLANSVTFSDIFETASVVPKKDAAGVVTGYESAPAGFTQIIAGHDKGLVENLKLKPGMEKAAAFLETRRYAAYVGATTEFEKFEGVSVNAKDNKVYLAMTRMSNGMENKASDPVNHIHIPKLSAGAVYEMPLAKAQKDAQGTEINSDYVGTAMQALVIGEDIAKDAVGNTGHPDKIANPDNIKYSELARTLFIGEDSSTLHINNFVWAYNIDSKTLTRIMSVPAGAESTGLQVIDNLNGFPYIMSNYQHAGDFSANINADLKTQLEPLIDKAKASIGYIAMEFLP